MNAGAPFLRSGSGGPSENDLAEVRAIAAAHDEKGALLPVLHDVQAAFGYIDDAFVPVIAEVLNLSRADVHGVVTFYHDFRRAPAGRHVVKLCRAESCQARGAVAIEQAMVERLRLGMGMTSTDQSLSLEPVYCLGLCAIGPNALVDGSPVVGIDKAGVERIAAMVGA